MKPVVYIISAPSGSGKSTLVNELLKLVAGLDFSISYTTRAPRGSEQDGKQYFFVSRGEFESMIQADEFLEYAEVFGNYYGTARRFLGAAEQQDHDLVLDIDVQGAEQIKKKLPEAPSIFILPPDLQTLERRLRRRSEDAETVIQRRLVTASREIENYTKYDYILVNDQLEKSIEDLQAIVRSERLHGCVPRTGEEARNAELAERCRLRNMQERIQGILESFASSPPAGGQ